MFTPYELAFASQICVDPLILQIHENETAKQEESRSLEVSLFWIVLEMIGRSGWCDDENDCERDLNL